MQRKQNLACLSIFMFFFFFIAAPVHAGIFWQTVQETKGMPGLPDSTETVAHYMTEDATRTEMGDTVTIMDFNTMMLYQLDKTGKTYTKMNLNEMGGMMGPGGQENQAVADMMKKMMNEVKVTPTGETANIAGYDCKKYLMSMMMVQSEYWVTKDIEYYPKLKEIGKQMSKKLENNPMMRQMNFAAHMEQMDGFPVRVVTSNPMGGKTVSTLKHIEEKNFDPALFQEPKGYKLTETPY